MNPRGRFRRSVSLTGTAFWGILLFACLLQGCAGLDRQPSFSPASRPADASLFFTALDDAVEREAVGDAAAFRLAGFPYLRTDRFLADMATRLETDAQRSAWLSALRQLDIAGREKEIRNLSENAVTALSERFGAADRSALSALVSAYGDGLLAADRARPGFVTAAAGAAQCNTEYSLALRVAGLYPIAAIPVALLTHKAHREFRGWHRTPPEDLPVRGELTDYIPPRSASEKGVAPSVQRDALGRPILPPEAAADRIRRFAPILRQDVANDADRPGRIIWRDGTVTVDVDHPTAYVYWTHAFFRDTPVVQIHYVFWYRARTGPEAPLIERGPIDGVTFRVSLAPDGRPFMLTIINNCGCYGQSFPHPDFIGGIAAQPMEIDAFAPAGLPGDVPPRHLTARINSGWHQVQNVGSGPIPPDGTVYEIRPYSDLESLPTEGGGHESIFNPDGIVKGSDRIEPYLLFSMGIPDVGAMRQRGHHATRLVGREHFDDPQTFNRNFIFKKNGAAP